MTGGEPLPLHRPHRLVTVLGTGTEVGKTWFGCGLLRLLRSRGLAVGARKPIQSFAPADASAGTDAHLLAAASGERPDVVCPPHRWLGVPMAPPMAAAVLGVAPCTLSDLLGELMWPPGLDVGLVETVGGVRSPLCDDADSATLAHQLQPEHAILVADAGLGTINAVRLAMAALAPLNTFVVLNRYDHSDDLHRRNLEWLRRRDDLHVAVDVREAAQLVLAAG